MDDLEVISQFFFLSSSQMDSIRCSQHSVPMDLQAPSVLGRQVVLQGEVLLLRTVLLLLLLLSLREGPGTSWAFVEARRVEVRQMGQSLFLVLQRVLAPKMLEQEAPLLIGSCDSLCEGFLLGWRVTVNLQRTGLLAMQHSSQ